MHFYILLFYYKMYNKLYLFLYYSKDRGYEYGSKQKSSQLNPTAS